MTGTFVDKITGAQKFFGFRSDKGGLEDSCIFLPGSNPRPSELHVWDVSNNNLSASGGWVESATLVAAEVLEEAYRVRRKAYGPIGDQLDEMYKDFDAWKSRISSVKAANPLPG